MLFNFFPASSLMLWQNELKCLSLATLTLKYYTRMKRVARDKDSGLFGNRLSDEGKRYYYNDKR